MCTSENSAIQKLIINIIIVNEKDIRMNIRINKGVKKQKPKKKQNENKKIFTVKINYQDGPLRTTEENGRVNAQMNE